MTTRKSMYSTKLNFELLEDRHLLAAAVGSFVRTDGYVVAGSGAVVVLEGPEVAQTTYYGAENEEVHDDGGPQIASASNDYGSGFAEQHTIAHAAAPIGIGTAVPVVYASAVAKNVVSNLASSGTGYGANAPGASAGGRYEYVPDPLHSTNLYYHRHVFVAVSRGVVVSDGGQTGSNTTVSAYDSNVGVGAQMIDPETNTWQWAAPGQEGTSVGGVNIHYVDTFSISPGSAGGDFGAGTYTNESATSPYEGDALSLTTALAAAWGYVTQGESDVGDGDFNADGQVDGLDYDLWEAASPLSDGDRDGWVNDDDDYAMWLANAAPKVENITISSTVSNPYGTNPPYSFEGVVGSEEQLRTVPVGGANRLAIQFTKDVDIASGDLDLIALNRVVTEPSVSDFVAPDATNGYTATWTFASALPGAQYLIRLSDSIQDLDSKALDGEWTNPGSILSSVTTSQFPSGDHFAGGDFEFVFTYLPGDINRDNEVSADDFAIFGGHYGLQSNMAWGDGDFTGEGAVNDSDFAIFAGYYGLDDWKDLAILADYDGDFDLDGDDETDFLAYYNSQNIAADLNESGTVTQADRDAFYDLFGFGIDLDVLS